MSIECSGLELEASLQARHLCMMQDQQAISAFFFTLSAQAARAKSASCLITLILSNNLRSRSLESFAVLIQCRVLWPGVLLDALQSPNAPGSVHGDLLRPGRCEMTESIVGCRLQSTSKVKQCMMRPLGHFCKLSGRRIPRFSEAHSQMH